MRGWSAMYAEPAGFDREELVATLKSQWSLTVASMRYEPVGFGTHHYLTRDDSGRAWFVNVDELASKVCISPGPAQALEALDRAFLTALALKRAGLEFVHAPVVQKEGAAVASLGDSYAVSVFEYVVGESKAFGEHLSDHERRLVLRALGRMHGATGHVPPDLPRRETLEIPLREPLTSALADVRSAWSGGPFSEPARLRLSDHEGALRRLLDRYDELAQSIALDAETWVVTHGEPHAGNQVRTGHDEFVLIDWDTAAIGPRERDLWMVEPTDDEDRGAYTTAGGTSDINPAAFELYRLWWTLTEVSLSTAIFRSSHSDDENTRVSWAGFESELAKLSEGGRPKPP